jgi:hypothetical protein
MVSDAVDRLEATFWPQIGGCEPYPLGLVRKRRGQGAQVHIPDRHRVLNKLQLR